MHLASETRLADRIWSRFRVQNNTCDQIIANCALEATQVVVHGALVPESQITQNRDFERGMQMRGTCKQSATNKASHTLF
jgi:hypothetical protein